MVAQCKVLKSLPTGKIFIQGWINPTRYLFSHGSGWFYMIFLVSSEGECNGALNFHRRWLWKWWILCWVVLSCVTTVITVATLVLSPQVWWVNWHDRNSIHGHTLQQLCLTCGCGYSYSWLTLGTSTATTKSVQQKLCARWSHSYILHSPMSFHGVLVESSQSPWSPCRVLIESMETPWGLHKDSIGTL